MDIYDVVVVGGGIAGAGVAYSLLEQAPSLSLALLEQEHIPGYHSTGRSAAIFREISSSPILTQFCQESRSFFEKPPASFGAQSLLHESGVLYIAFKDQVTLAEDFYRNWKATVTNLELLGIQDCMAHNPLLSSSVLSAGVLEPEAKEIDVAALHQGYLKAVRSANNRLHTDTSVTSLHHANGIWTIETTEDCYYAKVVVNATGAWADKLARMASLAPLGFKPCRRTIALIPGTIDPPLKPFPFTLALDASVYCKYESGNILISPCDEHVQHPADAYADDYDVAVAIERFEQMTGISVSRCLRRWAGLRTFSPDRLPVIGEDPRAAGFFWVAGLGGYGIKTSPAVSSRAASKVLRFLSGRESDVQDREELSPQRLISE